MVLAAQAGARSPGLAEAALDRPDAAGQHHPRVRAPGRGQVGHGGPTHLPAHAGLRAGGRPGACGGQGWARGPAAPRQHGTDASGWTGGQLHNQDGGPIAIGIALAWGGVVERLSILVLSWRCLGAILVFSWCYPDVVYRDVIVALSMEQRERSVFLRKALVVACMEGWPVLLKRLCFRFF